MRNIKHYNDIVDKKEYQKLLSGFVSDTSKKYGISKNIILDALETVNPELWIDIKRHDCFVTTNYALGFSLAITVILFRDIQNKISPKQMKASKKETHINQLAGSVHVVVVPVFSEKEVFDSEKQAELVGLIEEKIQSSLLNVAATADFPIE